MELYVKDKAYDERKNPWKHASKYNNKKDCENNKGKWVEFHHYLEEIDLEKSECTELPNGQPLIWAIPYRSENLDQFKGNDTENWKRCLVALSPPDCREAPYSRSNHLGNGEGVVTLGYPWKLPYFPSGKDQKCVLRIRYNFRCPLRSIQIHFILYNLYECAIIPNICFRVIRKQVHNLSLYLNDIYIAYNMF